MFNAIQAHHLVSLSPGVFFEGKACDRGTIFATAATAAWVSWDDMHESGREIESQRDFFLTLKTYCNRGYCW